MNKEYTTRELTELRGDLTYATQKVERLLIGRLSLKHRQDHPERYSDEDLASAKKELEINRFQLREVTDRMLPALQGLLQETVSI